MWTISMLFLTLYLLSYFSPGNFQMFGGRCTTHNGARGICTSLFNCTTLNTGGSCDSQHKWIVCCPAGSSSSQRRPWTNEIDSNYWRQRNPNNYNFNGDLLAPQEIRRQRQNTPIRIPPINVGDYDADNEPGVSILEWSEPKQSSNLYENNPYLNSQWDVNNRQVNNWRDSNDPARDDRPVWGRPFPGPIEVPSWQINPSTQSPIVNRAPSTIRPRPPPRFNPTRVESDTPLILNRQVGLKSREMCRSYCKKPIIPLSISIALRFSKPGTSIDPLIIGGRVSEEKAFPHMAAVGYGPSDNIQWNCGGSLISENFVLTAAHCLSSRVGNADWVLLGTTKIPRNGVGTYGPNYQLIAVTQRIRHPDYRAKYIYNDIALLRLGEFVQFNDYVRPACLPLLYGAQHQTAVASGWGKTNFRDRNSLSNVLMDVTLKILTPEDCPSNPKMPQGTNNFTQICAGELKGGKDTCAGDSGGPLQLQEGECGTTIVGIVSAGSPFCGTVNNAGLYTRVTHFLQWIEDTVWPPTESDSRIVQ